MNRETCQGCQIEECRVEVDGLCNRCDDVEEWLADHDKQIRDEAIKKFAHEVKEDVSARLKSRKHYLTNEGYEYEVEITRNLISALDYFVERITGEQNE